MKTTYLFHINTSYAELPKSEIKSVCKSSYIPFLKMLDKYELGEILLNLTGLSIEYFSQNNKKVLSLIKQLIEVEKLKITGSAYSHPILPLLPSDDIRKQIMWHKDLVETHLETDPIGFFPPELAVDPTLPKYLLEAGYKWIFVDGEALINSKKYPNSHSGKKTGLFHGCNKSHTIIRLRFKKFSVKQITHLVKLEKLIR